MFSEATKAKAACAAPVRWLPTLNFWKRIALFALAVLVSASSRPAETITPRQRESIQTRITNAFDFTVLFKPAESATNSACFGLAPLIIQEVTDTNHAALWREQFGEVSGRLVVCHTNTISLNGRTHDQFSYSWAYPSPASSRPRVQGIRMTLNAAGEPAIWEVLGDSTGADVFYVAQSLEFAARAEVGAPLPGRKFAVERGVTESPGTVVANVIDDGPTPMGPVIYLRGSSRDVSALICRCMASQGGNLLGQRTYELDLGESRTNPVTFFSTMGLEQRLRLPRTF